MSGRRGRWVIGGKRQAGHRSVDECTHAELRAGLSTPGCLLCRQEVEQQEKYLFWFVNEQYYEAGMVQAMRASRGFCLRHTRHLVRTAPPGLLNTVCGYILPEVLRALREAQRLPQPGRMVRLLRPSGACPACRADRESSDRTFGMLRRVDRWDDLRGMAEASAALCLPHFRHYAGSMSWPELESLGRITLEGLRHRGRELAPLFGLDRDHRLRLGEPGGGPEPDLTSGAAGTSWSPTLAELQGRLAGDGCVLCRSRREALRDYLRWLAAEVDRACHRWQDALFLCRVHRWDLVWAAGAAPAARLAAELGADRQAELDWLLGALAHPPPARLPHRLLQVPDKHRELRERGQGMRWRRRWLQAIGLAAESPSARLAALKGKLLLPHECPACRYLHTVTARQGRLLALALADATTWSMYERSVGLCLPDLRAVLSALPDQGRAAALVRLTVAKLEILAWELEETGRKQSWSVRYEPRAREGTAWLRAAAHLSGECRADDPLVGSAPQPVEE